MYENRVHYRDVLNACSNVNVEAVVNRTVARRELRLLAALHHRQQHRHDISYGVYIYHMLVINSFAQIGLVGSPIWVVAAVAATAGLATLSWFLVGRPALALKREIAEVSRVGLDVVIEEHRAAHLVTRSDDRDGILKEYALDLAMHNCWTARPPVSMLGGGGSPGGIGVAVGKSRVFRQPAGPC